MSSVQSYARSTTKRVRPQHREGSRAQVTDAAYGDFETGVRLLRHPAFRVIIDKKSIWNLVDVHREIDCLRCIGRDVFFSSAGMSLVAGRMHEEINGVLTPLTESEDPDKKLRSIPETTMTRASPKSTKFTQHILKMQEVANTIKDAVVFSRFLTLLAFSFSRGALTASTNRSCCNREKSIWIVFLK